MNYNHCLIVLYSFPLRRVSASFVRIGAAVRYFPRRAWVAQRS